MAASRIGDQLALRSVERRRPDGSARGLGQSPGKGLVNAVDAGQIVGRRFEFGQQVVIVEFVKILVHETIQKALVAAQTPLDLLLQFGELRKAFRPDTPGLRELPGT